MKRLILTSLCGLLCATTLSAQEHPLTPIPLDRFRDGIHHWNLLHKERNYQRYEPHQICEIADNMVAYQNPDGGWPKNLDWLAILNTDSVYNELKESARRSTVDNQNTYTQIEYLADVYTQTNGKKYASAVLKGLDYLLDTQYESGGWRGWDVDAITFNDNVTTGILELFRNILLGDSSYAWLDEGMRRRISNGYNRGLRLILDCQVVQDGVKTAWGQQHDHKTLLPVKARSYELPALTASESSNITLFLMEIENPSAEIVKAVEDAVAWFRKVQIHNLRIERVAIPEDDVINHEYKYDVIEVKDENAKPIWARFYELADNTPFMCTRAGEKVWRLADVDPERRTGYAWYGYWPEKVLKSYRKWKQKTRPEP